MRIYPQTPSLNHTEKTESIIFAVRTLTRLQISTVNPIGDHSITDYLVWNTGAYEILALSFHCRIDSQYQESSVNIVVYAPSCRMMIFTVRVVPVQLRMDCQLVISTIIFFFAR